MKLISVFLLFHFPTSIPILSMCCLKHSAILLHCGLLILPVQINGVKLHFPAFHTIYPSFQLSLSFPASCRPSFYFTSVCFRFLAIGCFISAVSFISVCFRFPGFFFGNLGNPFSYPDCPPVSLPDHFVRYPVQAVFPFSYFYYLRFP